MKCPLQGTSLCLIFALEHFQLGSSAHLPIALLAHAAAGQGVARALALQTERCAGQAQHVAALPALGRRLLQVAASVSMLQVLLLLIMLLLLLMRRKALRAAGVG